MITPQTVSYLSRRFVWFLVSALAMPTMIVGVFIHDLYVLECAKRAAPARALQPHSTPPVEYNHHLKRYEAKWPMRVAVLKEDDETTER